MIISQFNNTPVAAPEIANNSEALTAYRQFSGISYASAADLYDFISTPSQERTNFLEIVEPQLFMYKNLVVRQSI